MEKDTLSRLKKYDSLLDTKIKQYKKLASLNEYNPKLYNIYFGKANAYHAARDDLHRIFPELRAQESQLAEKTQSSEGLYIDIDNPD